MTTRALLLAFVIAACGGGKQAVDKPTPPPEPAGQETPPAPAVKAEPAPAPAPEPERAKPAPPKQWRAKATLDPVKGAKQKAATITFTQEEGKQTNVASSGWFDGLKPGKYHLVVHEAKECGPNATKAGKPFAPAAAADLGFEVAKDSPGNIDTSGVAVKLAGDDAIVEHTLVLHDDAKGKPGKALACGSITPAEE